MERIRVDYQERGLVLQQGAHPPESTTGAEGFGLFHREHHLQAVASGTAHPCGQVVSQMARVQDDLAHSGLGERFKVIVEQRPISDWDQGLRQVGGQRTEACSVSGRQQQRATHLMIDVATHLLAGDQPLSRGSGPGALLVPGRPEQLQQLADLPLLD